MKKKGVLLISVALLCMLMGFSSQESKSSEESNTSESQEEVTDITLRDLNGVDGKNKYIQGVSDVYAVEGYQGALTNNLSYDSDVIKDVEVESDEVDTSYEGEYPITYKITVDINEFCKKEGKKNGMTGDTTTITYDSKIKIISKEFAKDMVEEGADNILGYK